MLISIHLPIIKRFLVFHWDSLSVIDSIRLCSMMFVSIPEEEIRIPRCFTRLSCGLMFHGRGIRCCPMEMISVLFMLTFACDHKLYRLIVSIICFESPGDERAITQSSANAKDFTRGCPVILIPVILELIVLRNMSNVKL